jgi:hypothetical protein
LIAQNPIIKLAVRGITGAVLVVNALLLAVFFGGIALPEYFGRVVAKSPLMFQDFTRYYTFGWIARSPLRAELYDRIVQFAKEMEILRAHYKGRIPFEYWYEIDYTPPFALVMAPVTLLPYPAALIACQLFGLGLAGVAFYLLRGKGWRDAVIFLAGVAVTIFAWRSLAIGQLTWLIVGTVGMYFWCLLRGRGVAAGVLLALLATIKLQYAVYFAIPLLPLVQRKAIVAGGVTTLALWVASGLLFGWDAIWMYPSLLAHTQSNNEIAMYAMVCLRSLVDMVLHRPLSSIAAVLIALSGMAATFLIWYRCRGGDEEQRRWAVAATVGLALVTNFHAHNFDSLLLAVGFALTMPTVDLLEFGSLSAPRRLWSCTAVSLPVLSWIFMKIPDQFQLIRCVCLVLTVTYVTGLAIWMFWRSQKPQPSPSQSLH